MRDPEVTVRKLWFAGSPLWTARAGVSGTHGRAASLRAGGRSLFVGAGSGDFSSLPLVAALNPSGP